MGYNEAGRQLSYDAWSRLVGVKDSAGNPLASYSYDALGRRVSETTSAGTREFYYSADWQVLEEAVNGQVDTRYVWSPVYTDALVLRDRDTNGDGTLDERLWVQQDANFNVTALLNSSGQVVERYNYDPFGVASVLNADGTAKAGGSSYDWKYLHQGLRYDASTGLYDDRGRPYSPTLARFVQNDPKGFAAGDPDLYRYEGNGPTGGLDPSGLQDPRRAYWNGIPYDPSNPGDLSLLQYMDLGHRAKQVRQEQPYRVFVGGMFDTMAPATNPATMALQLHMATLDSMKASQVPLEQRAANRAALRAALADKIFSGDAEFYGQMTGTALILAAPGAKKLPGVGVRLARKLKGSAFGRILRFTGDTSAEWVAATESGTSGVAFGGNTEDLLLPRPSHPNAHGFSIRDVNPSGNRLNCAECSVYVDNILGGVQRRGQVLGGQTARAAADTLHLGRLEAIYGTEFSELRTLSQITSEMEAAKSGARGILFGIQEGATEGHFFNVVNQGGRIRFLCGQVGGQIDPSKFTVFRIMRTK